MSIQSDLQLLQSSLSEQLAIDVSLLVQLRGTSDADQGLLIWPWHIETAKSQNWLPPRQSPAGERLSAPRRTKIHLLILAADFSILSQAFDALIETPVLMLGDRALKVVVNALTADQTCSIFTASRVAMQAAISLTLEG